MANTLFDFGRQRFLEAQINWMTDTIKVILVDTGAYTPNVAAHQYLSDISASARIAVELGADVIKTRFTGTEDDRLIVEAAGVPVLALGGPKTGIDGYFKFVQHCMQVGAKGVAVGRNITQDPQPAKVVAGLNAIIHENATAEDAYSLYMAK